LVVGAYTLSWEGSKKIHKKLTVGPRPKV